MTRIYLGHLSHDTTEESLREALSQDGRTVALVNIKRNGTTGKPRGFAFVDMGSQEDAEAAIRALDGSELRGRRIKVSFAKELPGRRTGAEWHTGGGPGRGGSRRW